MTTAQLESRSRYTPEQITAGLTVLALCGGDAARAEAQLTEQGQRVPDSTLQAWRDTFHPERYRDICTDLAPQIEARVVHLQRELAVRATEGALLAANLERTRIENGEVKDAASSARNLSTVAGIAVDKILSLTGRPTSITEHRNADQVLGRLERLGLLKADVDSTATEVTDAETLAA